MDLNKIKSLDKASEKQLLQMVLSGQLQLLRRMEIIENLLRDKDYVNQSVQKLAGEMVEKFDTFKDAIDENLK